MTRVCTLLAFLALTGCGVPVTAGVIGATMGLGVAVLRFDEKLIDLYLSTKGARSCPLPPEGAPR